MHEAKKRLFLNVGSNITATIVQMVLGLFMTPFYIKHLGVEVAGLIPLASTGVRYLSFFTLPLTSSLVRYISLSINDSESNRENIYFNSSIFSIAFIFLILLLPILAITHFIDKLLNVPAGYESDFKLLFFVITSSLFISTIATPFSSPTIIKHRFELDNIARILTRLIQAGIVVCSFTFIAPDVNVVSISYLVMSVSLLILSMFYCKRLAPELRVKISDFKLSAAKEISQMSGWILIDQLGFLLYFSSDLIIINRILGPKAGGFYAPFVLVASMVSMFGQAFSNVFTPIAYEYIANNKTDELVDSARRVVKYIGMSLSFPVGLLSGFSLPLIMLWLGGDFAEYHTLILWLVLPKVIFLSVSPLYCINRGLNKVKVPALVTLFGGVLNVLLSVFLVKYTALGIYGAAVGTVVSLSVRHILFSMVYIASILKRKIYTFVIQLRFALISVAFVFTLSSLISRVFKVENLIQIIIASIIIGVLYMPLLWFILFDSKDRSFAWSLLGKYVPFIKGKE